MENSSTGGEGLVYGFKVHVIDDQDWTIKKGGASYLKYDDTEDIN